MSYLLLLENECLSFFILLILFDFTLFLVVRCYPIGFTDPSIKVLTYFDYIYFLY